MNAETRMPVHHPLRAEGLTVIDASVPTFMAEIEKFLEPHEIEAASSFLRDALIVVNNTGRYIWGFTIIYTFPNRISPAGTPAQYIISPSAGGPAHRSRMFEPGASYLVAPVSDFLASRNANGTMSIRLLLDEGMKRLISLFESKWGNERIEASVDSIIYEDGSLAGPDSDGQMLRINERIRAERDLALVVKGLAGEELRRRLITSPEMPSADEYFTGWTNAGQSVLQIINAQGESAAIDLLERMRTVQWFTNSGTIRRKVQ